MSPRSHADAAACADGYIHGTAAITAAWSAEQSRQAAYPRLPAEHTQADRCAVNGLFSSARANPRAAHNGSSSSSSRTAKLPSSHTVPALSGLGCIHHAGQDLQVSSDGCLMPGRHVSAPLDDLDTFVSVVSENAILQYRPSRSEAGAARKHNGAQSSATGVARPRRSTPGHSGQTAAAAARWQALNGSLAAETKSSMVAGRQKSTTGRSTVVLAALLGAISMLACWLVLSRMTLHKASADSSSWQFQEGAKVPLCPYSPL